MDPRIERTTAALRTAVLELATEHDIDDVTVSQVATRAGINRATFYDHASSPAELLTGILRTELDADLQPLDTRVLAHPEMVGAVSPRAGGGMVAAVASGFVPISASTADLVPASSSSTSTRKSMRFFGSMVVSLSWAAIISPRPLKRPISILPRPVNSVRINSSLCASFRA